MIFEILKESAQVIEEVLAKKESNTITVKKVKAILEKKGYDVNEIEETSLNLLFLEFKKNNAEYRFNKVCSMYQLSILNNTLESANIPHSHFKTKVKELKSLGYEVAYKKNDYFGIDFKA